MRDHAVAITCNATDPAALLADHTHIHPIHVDPADPASAAQVVAETPQRFGRLDMIVSNAGVIEADDGRRARAFDVNILAPVALPDAALPHLDPGAAIVNISSVNAVQSAVGALAYSASKAALNSWTHLGAKELGPKGIRVDAVTSGAIERCESPAPPIWSPPLWI